MDYKQQYDDEVAKARAILTDVKEAGRDSLTDAEERQARKHMKAARTAQLAGKLEDMWPGNGGDDVRQSKKLSQVISDKLRSLGAKDLTATPSLITSVDFIGGPGPLQGVMGSRIFSAFPQQRVSGGSVRYLRQTQAGGGVPAAVVAPHAAKPVSTWNVTNVDAPIPTIALISPNLANSVLRDDTEAERFIDLVLAQSIYRALDAEAYNALSVAATAAGNTQGFGTDAQTTLRKAVTQLEQDGFVPTHVFVNPSEHETLALAADDVGRYYFGGPVDANVPKAWSMQLVSSPGVTAGFAAVVAAPVAAIGVLREDVEFAVDGISGFNINESRIRAELRALLAVTCPNAVVIADIVTP